MLNKRKIIVYDTQSIIDKAQSLIKNPEKDFYILNIANTPTDNIVAAYNIMTSEINKDYYSSIRIFQLSDLLCLEVIKGELSTIQLEAECLSHIASYIFAIVNECDPKIFPIENPNEIIGYIKSHKKLIKNEYYTYIITKCLEDILLGYSLEYQEEAEMGIVINAIENTRFELLKKTRYDIEKYIRKKCNKFAIVKKVETDNSAKESSQKI